MMQQAWRGREGVQPMMSNEFHPQRKLHYDQSRRPPPIQEQSINIELRPDVSSASHCCSCSWRHRGPQILTNCGTSSSVASMSIAWKTKGWSHHLSSYLITISCITTAAKWLLRWQSLN